MESVRRVMCSSRQSGQSEAAAESSKWVSRWELRLLCARNPVSKCHCASQRPRESGPGPSYGRERNWWRCFGHTSSSRGGTLGTRARSASSKVIRRSVLYAQAQIRDTRGVGEASDRKRCKFVVVSRLRRVNVVGKIARHRSKRWSPEPRGRQAKALKVIWVHENGPRRLRSTVWPAPQQKQTDSSHPPHS